MLTRRCPPTYRAEGTQPTFLPSRVDEARHGTFLSSTIAFRAQYTRG